MHFYLRYTSFVEVVFMHPYHAPEIANLFLCLSQNEKMDMSNIKLQRLLFLTHATHLNKFDEPLLDDSFEAWETGPVCPRVFYQFKEFGHHPIKRLAQYWELNDVGELACFDHAIPNDNHLKLFFKTIWKVHAHQNPFELSRLCNAEKGPWDLARKKHHQTHKTVVITDELIRENFSLTPQKS